MPISLGSETMITTAAGRAVLSPGSVLLRRLTRNGGERGRLIDAGQGRRT